MAVTLEQVHKLLLAFEPDYAAAARLGPQILPHLKTLVADTEPLMAAKATYLASLIDDKRAIEILGAAAKRPVTTVRIAAASGARNLKQPGIDSIIAALLGDPNRDVRRTALEAVGMSADLVVLAKVNGLRQSDPEPSIRALAAKVSAQLRIRDIG